MSESEQATDIGVEIQQMLNEEFSDLKLDLVISPDILLNYTVMENINHTEIIKIQKFLRVNMNSILIMIISSLKKKPHLVKNLILHKGENLSYSAKN